MYDELEFWKCPNPEAIAFEYKKNIITYKELNEKINSIKVYFDELGIKKYDHVILIINNPLMYMEIFLALWKMNVTIIPLDYQLSLSQMKEIIQISDANYIISNKDSMSSEFENMDKEYSNLKKILMIRKREANVITVNSDSKKVSWIKKNDFDIGYIMLFTSGTSGHSKGVLLRKELFLRNVKQVIEYTSLTNEDVLLVNLPLSYSFALSEVCAHLLCGGKIILSTNNVYNALILLEIKEKNVTNYPAIPYFYETLAKDIELGKELSVGNLKFFMSAGGYLNPFVIETIVKKFPGISFYNNYGQTEASPRLCFKCFNSESKDFLGVGTPLKGVEIDIFDNNRHKLKEGNIGEIGYKSEYLMLGYYKNKILNKNEYFMSGDLGYFEKGNLVIVGRTDSLIKINGRKVYKNRIENTLFQLPYISNIKIKKERHDIYGEYFVAYVVPKKDENPKEVIDKVYEFCKLNFNLYERPKKIVICNEIHLSSNKKVQLKE